MANCRIYRVPNSMYTYNKRVTNTKLDFRLKVNIKVHIHENGAHLGQCYKLWCCEAQSFHYTGLRLTTPKHNFVACDWFIIFPMFGFRTCQLAFCKQKTCQTDKIDVFINFLVTYDIMVMTVGCKTL